MPLQRLSRLDTISLQHNSPQRLKRWAGIIVLLLVSQSTLNGIGTRYKNILYQLYWGVNMYGIANAAFSSTRSTGVLDSEGNEVDSYVDVITNHPCRVWYETDRKSTRL